MSARRPTLTGRSLLLAGAALAGLIAPGLSAAGGARAQGAASADEGAVLPEIDVQATAWRSWQPIEGYVAPLTTTGTKTDTPVIEAPQSLGIVTRDQMDDQGVRSVSQALRYTAGVQSELRPGARYDTVYVRGFGGQGSGAAYVNFLDGLRQQRGISYAIPNVDPWLLERIEVLRGPASVLYGQTGSGGIVNLVSRRPTEEPVREVRLEAGNNNFLQTSFDFGGKLTEDGRFLYRLTGLARDAGSQYDGNNDEQRIAVAPAITWRPDADTTLTVLANYQYDPESGFYNFAPARGTVLPNTTGRTLDSSFFGGDPNWNNFERRLASIGYQFEKRLDQTWTIRQNFRYQHIDSEFRAVSGRSLSGATLTRQATHSIEHADTFALDNQAQASVSTGPLEHTVLMGLDYNRSSAKRRLGSVTTVASLNIFNPVYGVAIPAIPLTTTTQILDQVGIYAQDQIALDRWRFSFGVRGDMASNETITRSSGVRTHQVDNAFTGRLGALYLFDNGLAPYASYATSFQPNSGYLWGGEGLKPTMGEMFEAGVKYQPPGMNSFVQVAAFQITQSDVAASDTAHTGYYTQIGEIRSRGIEVEARASLTENLDLIGTYAYTQATITQSTTADAVGKDAPSVPRNMASLWADYTIGRGAFEGLGLGGGLRYIDTTPGNETNTFRVPAFTLYDAAIRYDLGAVSEKMKGASVALNVSNLFDKEYIASCSSETSCFYGLRRTVIASLRYKW